jgi:Tol biopolymer transport system component
MPDWSPVGDQMLLVTSFDNVYGIFSYNVNSDTLRPLVSSLQPIISPAWSPDGQQIAYATSTYDSPDSTQIVVVYADGTNRHVVTPAEGWPISHLYPAWRPSS